MSSKKWIDERGFEIPENRITKAEKLRERKAQQLMRDAVKANAALVNLKQALVQYSDEVFEVIMKESGVDMNARKGNFTWYSFDRSIRIERSLNDRIDFDDILIAAAKELFNEFMNEETGNIKGVVRGLLMRAFSTRSGRLDPKRVMDIVHYRQLLSPNEFPLFHKAVDLIEQSIRHPESKIYYRIALRDEQGQYKNIDLNVHTVYETIQRTKQPAALSA